MKKITLLCFVLLFSGGQLFAQYKSINFPPRLKWLSTVEDLDVHTISHKDLLMMIDTLDKDSYNEREMIFLNAVLGDFEKKWMAVHSPNKPFVTHPSTAIQIQGMVCDICEIDVRAAILAVPGIKEVLEVNRHTGQIRYSFDQEVMPTIEMDVRTALEAKLKADQYKVLWSHEKSEAPASAKCKVHGGAIK